MNNYKTGYTEALAWIRALSMLLNGTAKAEREHCADPTRRAALDGAIELSEEFLSQIDQHAKDFLSDADVDAPLPPSSEGLVQ